ncbi:MULTISPECIES: SDR family oxidoreductase [unclassified Streptomyces]|uniref:SDR family oxidoreductase n=1 Tax=unclassified Streptomyces TaxID=2593676 RepID=UPI0011CC250A|nr:MULTISPECIES: SDR family oxidoreductase [unclassified Streptomyces]TXS09514.1 SDR family oxidoreductase [Streptomyces sp. wa22]WSQ85626.1 SDR family oxidoreductase [Streptomyces sp. NBC_01212]WSR08283.1 SDR family oxidoreductase [Streptomyces sp. NBC_01208]WSR48969.1 SDR family oxidoreductase [Streptomyces sp. NBC_01201]
MTVGTAVVTGAGSGVGRACALGLLADGWTVVLTGRRRAPLEETSRLAPGQDRGRAVAVSADITDPAAVDALFSTVKERFGRLDLLFNNAADTMPYTPTEEVRIEDWNRVMASIATGTFLCSRAAFRMMKEQSPRGGRIINNGAPSAQAPRPDSVAFTAAKHAVAGLTRSLSLDGRRHDISCGQIDIGNVTPEDRPQPAVRQADGSLRAEPTMDMRHVVDMVRAMAALPAGVNVQSVLVMPSSMPYVGRG